MSEIKEPWEFTDCYAASVGARMAYEHIAEWCEEQAAEALAEGRAQGNQFRMAQCEGEAAALGELAAMLREKAK